MSITMQNGWIVSITNVAQYLDSSEKPTCGEIVHQVESGDEYILATIQTRTLETDNLQYPKTLRDIRTGSYAYTVSTIHQGCDR